MNTSFYNNVILKKGSQCIGLSVILIDSVYRKDKSFYTPVFLQEYKYFVKEKRTSKFITDDSDRDNFDEENSNEEN